MGWQVIIAPSAQSDLFASGTVRADSLTSQADNHKEHKEMHNAPVYRFSNSVSIVRTPLWSSFTTVGNNVKQQLVGSDIVHLIVAV